MHAELRENHVTVAIAGMTVGGVADLASWHGEPLPFFSHTLDSVVWPFLPFAWAVRELDGINSVALVWSWCQCGYIKAYVGISTVCKDILVFWHHKVIPLA